jgi:hypothetical protein
MDTVLMLLLVGGYALSVWSLKRQERVGDPPVTAEPHAEATDFARHRRTPTHTAQAYRSHG